MGDSCWSNNPSMKNRGAHDLFQINREVSCLEATWLNYPFTWYSKLIFKSNTTSKTELNLQRHKCEIDIEFIKPSLNDYCGLLQHGSSFMWLIILLPPPKIISLIASLIDFQPMTCQFITGLRWRDKDIHTYIHNYRQFRVTNYSHLHVFGMWEKEERVNPHRHGDNRGLPQLGSEPRTFLLITVPLCCPL